MSALNLCCGVASADPSSPLVIEAAALADIEPFARLDPEDLQRVAGALHLREFEPAEVIYEEGGSGDSFLVILEGEVGLSRRTRHGHLRDLGTAGTGSLLGELAMLTGEPRTATLTAATAVTAADGSADAFELLLHLPPMLAELTDLASRRLAEMAAFTPLTLPDGTELFIRPLLPSDRADFATALARQPEDWRRRRFFSATTLSPALIDYLVHIDHVRHFAWVIAQSDPPEGIGVGRYVRSRVDGGTNGGTNGGTDAAAGDAETAEVAFEVDERWRGRGIGTILLGALAAAAAEAGIERFHAEMLVENAAMRGVFAKAGARLRVDEPGVLTTEIDVADALQLVDETLRSRLGEVAHDIVTAAGLAVRREPPPGSGGSPGPGDDHGESGGVR